MELAVAHHDHQDHHHNFMMLGSSSSTDLTHLTVKGKRTKRQRSSSPSSCSSSRQLELGLVVANYGSTSINSASSPATTSSTDDQEQDQVVVQEEEDEEDMANCLILLAQGHHHHHNNNNKKQALYPRKKIEKLPPPPPAIITKSGFYVYECKTCNRTFPSFQALGGHRASHKKPKLGGAGGDEKKGSSVNTGDVEGNCQLNKSCSDHHPQLLPQLPNNNNSKGSGGNNLNFQLGNSNSHKGNKIHECSICGSEFMSGQALGGHMRRHRVAAAAPPNSSVDGDGDGDQKEMIRPRSVMLGLDLNLPAPEDEQQLLAQQSKFQFVSSKQQTPSLVLAAPALVDCHY